LRTEERRREDGEERRRRGEARTALRSEVN